MELKYNNTRTRFELHSLYTELEQVRAIGGLQWDKPNKVWYTPIPERAARYIAVADDDAKRRLGKIASEQQESLAASHAVSADIEVPAPPGYRYRPFQLAGVKYAIDHPYSMNCDIMGSGKTPTTIGVINALDEIKSVLVFCPANAKNVWTDHCKRWLARPLKCGVAYGSRLPIDVDVLIINYDIAYRHEEALRSRDWDLLVLDECHVLKSMQARRSQMIFGYTPKAKEIRAAENDGTVPPRGIAPIPAKRYLSGTPMVNRPKELWPILHSLDPVRWNSEWSFYMKYCGATQERIRVRGGKMKTVWDLSGSSNESELQLILRANYMIRRELREILPELPPKVIQTIVLDPTPEQQRIIDEEMIVAKPWITSLDAIRSEMESAKERGDAATYGHAASKLAAALSVGFKEMARVRHATGVAKIPTIIEYAKDLLENQEVPKLGIWLHHHAVVDAVRNGLAAYGCVSIVGGDTDVSRKKAEQAFQNDPKTKVFIGSITAAGVAITLTAGRMAIAGEFSFVPGEMAQAFARHHRIGTTGSVLIQQIVLKGSLDERILEISEGKQEVADAILDDPIPVLHSSSALSS
jgi:SWI/SNF-related matrix-associated actin-dependent regulator 1 of chromatin subfamily A